LNCNQENNTRSHIHLTNMLMYCKYLE